MSKIINEITRYHNIIFDHRHLYVLFTKNGAIIEIINPKSLDFIHIISELEETKTLSPYFDLSNIQKSNEVFQLRSQKPFLHNDTLFDLYTSLSQVSMVVQSIGDNQYLGRIAILRFSPDTLLHNSYTYCMIDSRNDNIIGVTNAFYHYFKDKYTTPTQMLGMPAHEFMSPTPESHQRENLSRFSINAISRFNLVFNKDYSSNTIKDNEEHTPTGGTFQKQTDGLLWTNDNITTSYITLLHKINTHNEDFVIEYKVKNIEGNGPFVILGDSYRSKSMFPDDNGYFAGPAFENNKAVLIKKCGFILKESTTNPSTELQTYRFCKYGNSLYLFRDQTLLIAYYDINFYYNTSHLISFGLRPGYCCLLSNIAIRFSPALIPAPKERFIVSLKSTEKRYLTVDRYFNSTLSLKDFSHASGFILNDITPMHTEIQSLSKQVTEETTKSDKLKAAIEAYKSEETIIYVSSSMNLIKSTADTVAATNVTVLLEGSTGTGKDVIARYIHKKSERNDKPFIKIDCSTIPQNLMESILFGHEKGAFTGAYNRHVGLFEKADGGTLFLDEAENLTLASQAKLLHFFNDHTITRVGDTHERKINVRIIVASNVPLLEKVDDGSFRQDLFYRLRVVKLQLPPLKDRPEDIPVLALHFLEHFNLSLNKNIQGFTKEALHKLATYSWPGNIRELKNVIHGAIIFSTSLIIDAKALNLENKSLIAKRKRTPLYLSITNRETVVNKLKENLGHITKTAQDFNIARVTLHRFLKENNINSKMFRSGLGNQ